MIYLFKKELRYMMSSLMFQPVPRGHFQWDWAMRGKLVAMRHECYARPSADGKQTWKSKKNDTYK